jgi:hypothetical protein
MKVFTRKKMTLVVIFAIAGIFINSCCKPGLDGNLTLIAYPTHHGTKVYYDTIMVKYNGTTYAGGSAASYDHVFIGKPGDTTVICDGLGCGQYYFFARGYDSLRKLYVTGGLSVSIPHKQRNQTQLLNIAVTE